MRNAVGVAHHLEDGVEVVVVEVTQLDVAHTPTVPSGMSYQKRSGEPVQFAHEGLGGAPSRAATASRRRS